MPLGGLLPYDNGTKRPRSSPKERGKVVSDMSRSDSLASIREFGTVLPKAEQAARRAEPMNLTTSNPFTNILNALMGKKGKRGNAKP